MASDSSDLQKYIDQSVKIDDGPPARYQLKLQRINLDQKEDKESDLRRFTLGQKDPKHLNKTVLMVGATGSGKSTLIHALVNFVMGVKFTDKVWFEVITDETDRPQSETQTFAVSVYEIFGFEGQTVPYSLTIIDTPGYGDTRGIEYDHIVIQKLQDLFCINDGVKNINAVCLVMKATENRVDERMAYIFNSVTSMFGKDMEQNIVVMMTHSTGGKPTNALQALDDAKVKYARDKKNEPVYFCFNNRQKEKSEDSGDEEDAEYAFKSSNRGLKKFTELLGNVSTKSLKSTVNVMKERDRLTACMQNLKERVKTIESKQSVIKYNKKELEKHKTMMEENKNFEITQKKTSREKEQLTHWWDNKATTCNNCKENCHYPECTVAIDPSWCKVMTEGRCTSCSGKCSHQDHVKECFIYVDKITTFKTTIECMQEKYLKSEQESQMMEPLVQNLEAEMVTLKEKKRKWLNKAFHHIEKLEKIALNVNSPRTFIYLDDLIEKMEEINDTEKVQALQEMKGRMDEKSKEAGLYYMKSMAAGLYNMKSTAAGLCSKLKSVPGWFKK